MAPQVGLQCNLTHSAITAIENLGEKSCRAGGDDEFHLRSIKVLLRHPRGNAPWDIHKQLCIQV